MTPWEAELGHTGPGLGRPGPDHSPKSRLSPEACFPFQKEWSELCVQGGDEALTFGSKMLPHTGDSLTQDLGPRIPGGVSRNESGVQ